jgi:glycerate 2-kinase
VVRILAAFDKCKDSLTAGEICALAKKTIQKISSTIDVEEIPITDGGEGFAELLTKCKSGDFHHTHVKDSLGREIDAPIGLVPASSVNVDLLKFMNLPKSGKLAVVEMSSAAGLSDLKMEERDPWSTSSYGVGQLLLQAAELGVVGILLGIGGTSTNDMGVGALSALGVKFSTKDNGSIAFPNPATWSKIDRVSIDNLYQLPPIRIACDVNNPLLGENGATYQFGPQKGLSLDQKQEMEIALERMSELLSSAFQKSYDIREEPGTGAAGGMGYGLSLGYNVEFIPGFSLVKEWFEIESKIKDTDLILTGEGRFDKTSLHGKGPYELIRMASEFNKKVILLAGSIDSEAVLECKTKFPNVEFVSFGKEELKLQENLDRAAEFFQLKLNKALSFLP